MLEKGVKNRGMAIGFVIGVLVAKGMKGCFANGYNTEKALHY